MTDPRDMTLAALEIELEVSTAETPVDTYAAAYVERIDTLSGIAHDFITEALKTITYEHFDETTRDTINRDEIPEDERRLIHAMIQAASITIPERAHVERIRDELGARSEHH